MVSLIGWMLFGLVAGTIARLLHPGFERMGMLGTMFLGIVGSLVGGG
ncbi:MAG: GlsB/YeaQ/YmgE family stress response membrane protein, partial [Planctomycetaceae bacterium]|nr:GlsB/YeaQ/YmgE family stress response membrane protein [Planctomycetaceae bacterium]